MKLKSVVFLLAVASSIVAPAVAQSKPVVRRSAARPAAKTTPTSAASACPDALPTLGATIPKVEGCPKPLYALRYIDNVVGSGAPVQSRKWLTVAYTGYLVDGTKFDTSIGKDPITFPYGAHQVIAGWDTGFEGMLIGGKRRLFIPYELAYGETGRPPTIPAKSTLIFDVELIAISDNPPAPKAPPVAPAGSTPAKPGTPAPSSGTAPGGTQPPTAGSAQSTVGKPTATPLTPAVDPNKPKTTPPADPTKPTSVPPSTTPKPQGL